MMKTKQGWIKYSNGDKRKLMDIHNDLTTSGNLARTKYKKSEYGQEVLSWRKTWPNRFYEHGIYGRFIFYRNGRGEFIPWNKITRVYELHLESPSGKWNVLQIETKGLKVCSIPFLKESERRIYKRFKRVYR